MRFKFGLKEAVFLIIFSGLVLIGSKINFSPVIGAENQFFTLFQFFGPIAGGFLGAIFGPLAVLVAETTDFLLTGKAFSPVNLLRLLPMIGAAWYFSTFCKSSRKKSKSNNDKQNNKNPNDKSSKKQIFFSTIIPILAITAFIAHPVGRQAWFFSLFWLIPIIAHWLPGRLLSRSFGATFTAHAIGSALWIWTVPMPVEAWIALIPTVIMERGLFAIGISVSYVVMNTVLDKLPSSIRSIIPEKFVYIDKRYVLLKNL